MSSKQKSKDPRSKTVRDNVPAGMVISLDGIPPAMSFASMFRDELMARGIGIPRRPLRPGKSRGK